MNLQEQGFRFVRRIDDFLWVHAAEMRSGDLDCTDMTDEQFEIVSDFKNCEFGKQHTYLASMYASCPSCAEQKRQAALEALVAACREEHGGKHYEPDCPICEALGALQPSTPIKAGES